MSAPSEGLLIYVSTISVQESRKDSLQYHKDKDKDKDSFIGQQEFVVGYSKAPEQPRSSARPICHSHAMMSTGCEPTTIRIAV